MNRLLLGLSLVAALTIGAGCKRDTSGDERNSAVTAQDRNGAAPTEVVEDHRGHEGEGAEDHGHDEVALGTVAIGDLEVTLAQGHGAVEATKEGHLIVKLPYNDNGATAVRAWIGTDDRTASFVGKGTYAPSHDDYDIHAIAPDPLPADVKWWIEIEKPDGTKALGSAEPIL